MRTLRTVKRITAYLLLSVILANILIMPLTAFADKQEQKVVRVGWFDSSFCYFDSFGRRCGIDYEYHQKVSAYTGWDYEYVDGSWPELLEKLKNGEIDLLSDVSYKPEREEFMFFSDLPMGTEAYYIYVSAENRVIKADDLSTFNGKRIGANKGSVQEGFLKDWADKNGLSIEIVPLTCTEDESMEMITKGELDGLATIFTFDINRDVMPVSRIGGSDYFYAVSKSRPDLIEELNMAMAEIQDLDPYFNERISQNRIFSSKTNALLTPQQEDWLKEHGEIRIGYRDNYLPFCSTDEETKELTGALKEYLTHAVNNINSPNLKFKTVPYASTDEALKALESGEVDCVFPVYLSTYDADTRGIRLTDPAMETEMNAILRTSDRQDLSDDTKMIFAVNANMINVETFIMDLYPQAERKYFDGLQACYDAVAGGQADCVLVSNYRIPSEEDTLNSRKLYTVPTGESLPLSFAVGKSDKMVYSVMNKTALSAKSSEMDSALASYMLGEQKVTFVKFLKDNWLVVLAVLTVLFVIILFLLSQKLRAERIANKQRRLLEEAEQISELQQTVSSLLNNMPGVYLTKDAKTGEYLACNQAFADYIHKKDPSEVVGLTTADLFDEEKAKRFSEDDKMVLSMDEPLIYYDNMEDSFGNPVNVKITKQKYTDTNGRLCVLGIVQDVSNSFRISRDKASTKESYEKARSTSVIFTHIAQALASGYMVLYYVDLVTEEFIEYRSDAEDGTLSEVRRAWHFFEEGQDAAEENVHPDDRQEVIRAMDRKTLEATLDQNNVFMITYRMITGKEPMYVSMKVTRMQDDKRYIILSITDVDEQMKHRHAAQRAQEEQTAYTRISALAGDFLCIYVVVPETGRYREYSSAAGFDSFALPSEGENFFSDLRQNSIKAVYQEDQNRVFTALTMENALEEVEKNGIFTLSYRLMMNDEPRYVQLKAAIVEEQDGRRLVVGVNDIDAQVRQEEEYGRRLAQARIEANIDALTGVKNRNAYRVYEERLNAQIEMNRAPDFAIVILDVNDLKKVNDNEGHKAGDQFLRDACRIICTTFKRSPVFRVGGDEFAVICQGDDYSRLDELIKQMNDHNEEAVENGGIVIALGMSVYEQDAKVAQVYERADQRMYENKSYLKGKKKQRG
ncbi:diguanylate cyclase (GGDEF) domain-containing protein [Ruminococcaceae bacterium FB2012]|nr:diguanylate cyclase (GGDEF) domain-containing protein [Ruminococcaceae bacterium FB2012]